MGLTDLLPPAPRWSVVASSEVVPYSRHDDKATKAARLGQALVADGPGGLDDPVLRLAYADLTTKADWALDTLQVMGGDASAGTTAIGFGAARHALLVRSGEGWRVGGQLVRHGRKRVSALSDHRYAVVVDGTELGELGRQCPDLYWVPRVGPGLVARERSGGTEPAQPAELKGFRAAQASFRKGRRGGRPDGRWLEQTQGLRGTWDVWDPSGLAVATVCPPGGAHSTRWAVLPQPGAPAAAEAVVLAFYRVFIG